MAKRKRGDDHTEETSCMQKPPSKKQQKPFSLPAWSDIPNWTTNRTPILEVPVELLDKIFSPESKLELQDHLALAGTCRQIRAAYTDEVWQALHSYIWSRDRNIAWRIFSAALFNNTSEGASGMPTVASENDDQTGQSSIRTKVAEVLNKALITSSQARSSYKLTEKELLSLPFETRRNPHNRLSPMKLFRRARVYALAMRVHGGPLGHLAHLKKLAERDAKAKATREKNGTIPVKKPKAASTSYMTYLYPHDEPDEYDYDEYLDGY